MIVVDKTDRSQTDEITFELELKHRPAKVWRALTDPALLSQWLLPVMGFALEPGAAFRFQAPPQPGWDGSVSCRLVEIEPQRRLRYTWVVGGLDTVVTFTLTPTETGTRLKLVQSGFKPDQKQNFGGARYGWRLMGERLVGVLANQDEENGNEDQAH
jgi:uncharacterized protein YndB with AHSA1/START domain